MGEGVCGNCVCGGGWVCGGVGVCVGVWKEKNHNLGTFEPSNKNEFVIYEGWAI
jgi:hypothetical protein